MKLVFNRFETDIFGVLCGTIISSCEIVQNSDSEELNRVLQKAKKHGYKFISFRCPEQPIAVEENIKRIGFRKIESLKIFEKKIGNSFQTKSSSIFEASANDINDLKRIATSAFAFDRFHVDNSIPNKVASNIKSKWIENSVKYRALAVFAHKTDGQTDGFISLIENESVIVIDLIAVSKNSLRKKIGTHLVTFADNFFSTSHLKIRVGTQEHNTASCLLYKRLNFSPVSTKTTFHWSDF